MDKGDPCEICGGTESNLVDGFYYCTECGTQDTNVRETLVERRVMADGTFAISQRQKISRKLKEGIKMSAEWYKWHTLNFILAGLTEQLVRLGAAPSLKMKVLWIWTRYIKEFQKKDQMKQTQMFSKLEASSESEDEAEAAAAAAGEQRQARAADAPLRSVTRFLLAAVLALALNLDDSALQPSDLVRLVLHRLLDLNSFHRLVPADVDPADVPGFRRLCATPLSRCTWLPHTMGRLARRLALGPPRAPDLERLLAERLRELRLPPGLGGLALALMQRAPIPFVAKRLALRDTGDRHPDYEAVVTAYALVALKMCFGLDDDRERRLSAAVDRLNAEAAHPRAYTDAPGGTARLFSPREWLEHLRFRAAALSAHYAPLAWERNLRADGATLVEHFEEHAYAGHARRPGRADKAAAARAVADRLAMDVLRDIPAGAAPHVVPAAALRPSLAARAPLSALAEAVAEHARDDRTRRLLREDFTRYSAEYAYRTLALPDADPGLFEGVAEAGKTVSAGPDRDYNGLRSDPTVVHVRNCENENWFRTRRPTARHVVGPGEPDAEPAEEPDAEPAEEPDAEPSSGPDPESDGAAVEKGGDGDPETFREEAEGENIFDDDFWDVHAGEQVKVEREPEDLPGPGDGPEPRPDGLGYPAGPDGAGEREGSVGAFDSDEEGPRYDPAAFDRHRTIRDIMVAAYREYRTGHLPARFAGEGEGQPLPRARREPAPRARRADLARAAAAAARRERSARVHDLVAQYRDNLRRDALHQVARQVAAFVDAAERRMEAPDASSVGEAPVGEAPVGEAPVGEASVGEAFICDASSTDTPDVRAVDDDSDDEAARGPAEDPVYRGSARFAAGSHDARQLYVRLARAPRAAPEPAEPDDGDEAVARLLDEKIAAPVPHRRRARVRPDPIDFARIDHLVDDPEGVTVFRYWVTHYTPNFRKFVLDSDAAQQSFDETLPVSFRLVLRECAAQLHLVPMLLYRYVMDVEDAMMAAVEDRPRGKPRGPPKRIGRPPGTRNKNKACKKRVSRKPEMLDDDVDDDVSSAILFL